MIEVPYTPYKIILIQSEERFETIKREILRVRIPRKLLKTEEYLVATTYHFLDSTHLRERWIKDDVYRFLGFYLRETQISRIKEITEEGSEHLYIVLAEDGEGDVAVEKGMNEVMELARFRVEVEKERWSQ